MDGLDFYMDGFYVIPLSTGNCAVDASEVTDIKIESLHFIEESLLVATLSSNDVRVFYT